MTSGCWPAWNPHVAAIFHLAWNIPLLASWNEEWIGLKERKLLPRPELNFALTYKLPIGEMGIYSLLCPRFFGAYFNLTSEGNANPRTFLQVCHNHARSL